MAAALQVKTVYVPHPPGFYAPSAHGRMATVSHAHFCAAQVKSPGCYVQRKR